MPTYFTDFVSVHDVAHVGLETSLATSHSCKNGLDTSTHDHVIFRVGFVAKQGTDRNSVHGKLLLEVSENL